MPEFTTLINGLSFTEGLRWRDGRLYVSDLYTHRVLAVEMDGTAEMVAYVPEQPSGLGFLPDGRMLIVSMRDRKILRREADGSLVEHADLSGLAPCHVNDMLVDHDGRAWVGNFGFDLMSGAAACSTVLICVEPDGSAEVVADGLGFPNGMALTPDGCTLIVAESIMNRLSAFNVVSGSLGERHTWASFGDLPTSSDAGEVLAQVDVAPDGICLDAEGAVWVADAMHSRLIRVAEGGRILEERKTNGVGVFACMLGGDDGRTLFASAAPTFDEAKASANHRASILVTKVEVPHAGLP
ncbi:MAG TPA: SMP-30/gluconolactonase/LRE family protein [Terriglobia bacterium]|jgi:sugar lactone lactonase YvrE|nr:SMP-30/gluconolactonase/LRE family protein [Terriglobia bacterium]